ncbi:MAG TPA: helix-turn-helix transcriptional regulator [Candidatus Dormibacteraeota bacterium]|jgi:DNA-binding PadR family transcriptional regulator|nr:helix-turn-helix transcriptional regulator [Candidatus Dormibacteraeota bacterium]
MASNRVLPRTPALSLAVLSLLGERPMHPYEMQGHMRQRGHERVIKLNIASVYDTVERLIKLGLIRAGETSREGRRPERTVYEITDLGRRELHDWILELLSRPVPEFPRVAAALAFILMVPEAEALAALDARVEALTAEIDESRRQLAGARHARLPRIVLIEEEYLLAMRRAELKWTRALLADLREGTLRWPTAEDWAAVPAMSLPDPDGAEAAPNPIPGRPGQQRATRGRKPR